MSVINRILEDDLIAPKKQRHTAKYGFASGYTIIKDYFRER